MGIEGTTAPDEVLIVLGVIAIGEDLEELGIAIGPADVLGRTAAGSVQEKRIAEAGYAGFDLLDLNRMRPSISEIVEVLDRKRVAGFDRPVEAHVAGVDATMLPVGIGDAVLNAAEAKLIEAAVGPAEHDLEHGAQAAEPHGNGDLKAACDPGLDLVERDLEARDGGYAAAGNLARNASIARAGARGAGAGNIGDAREHVGEPGLRIDVVEPGGGDTDTKNGMQGL